MKQTKTTNSSQQGSAPQPSPVERAKPRDVESIRTGFRFVDFIVILLCLFVVAYFANRFWLDLNQTIDQQNVEPVGTITIRQNTVQRRIADRVLWDRLRIESPVYLGDIIRVAELSAATLNIEGQQLDLDENTLIRIQLSPEGALQVELTEGNLGLTTAEDGGTLQLNLMGRVVEAEAGTALVAFAGAEGLALQVNEGRARILPDGALDEDGVRARELSSGTMLALDSEGAERLDAAAVVTRPLPNARYVKDSPGPLSVAFTWNRVNLPDEEDLRLEAATDRAFTRAVRSVEGLASSAEISLEAGQWNWRLLHGDAVLSSGRLTVVDSGVELQSPARGSLFLYQDEQPQLRFQWSEVEEASHYIIEAASTSDFSAPVMSRELSATFFMDAGFGEGTWYWRVRPAFSAAYTGDAAWSTPSFFRIENQAAGSSDQAAGFIDSDLMTGLEQELNPEESEAEPPEPEQEPLPVEVRLVSPAHGASMPGLAALRGQAEFRWDSGGDSGIARSRFVLSQNENPLLAPAVEIVNPGSTIRLDSLGQGTWYWTVEAMGEDGLAVAAEPRQFLVQSIPVLNAPGNRRPSSNYRVGIEHLRTQTGIDFSWTAVQGANAYIVTLYEETGGGRRQLSRVTLTRAAWRIEDVKTLGRGNFVWQVEAVNRNQNGVIEQRGRVGENSFTIDIPLPNPVQMVDPGVIYGL